VKTLSVGGDVRGQVDILGNLKTAQAGSFGPNARLAVTGGIGSLRTFGDLLGQVQAGADIRSVIVGENLSADVLATRHIGTVKAGAIVGSADDLTRIIAGSGGLQADVASVKVTGGIAYAELRATRHVKAVTAGLDGIRHTHISAGVAPGQDGLYETRDDQVFAASVSSVSTTGPLEDARIIAGVQPEQTDDGDQADDAEFGKFNDTPPAQVADNGLNIRSKIGGVKAAQYLGDVRLIAGSDKLGSYKFANVSRTASESSGPNTLTLIRAVRRPDGQPESQIVLPA